jgi:hypothetical protein
MTVAEADTEKKESRIPIECDKDMACLKGREEFPLCQVDKQIADLLFVTANPLPSCRHMRYFGDGAYCTCPVRKELHKRHNI